MPNPAGSAAYQRWQFATLSADDDVAVPEESPQQPMVSDEELGRITESARVQGYAAGFASGRDDGKTAVDAEAAHLRRLVAAIGASGTALQADTAAALLALATDIARHVLRAEIEHDRAAILPAIREAIDLASGGAHPQLLLNPADIDFVRRHLGEDLAPDGWRLAEDARIEPGGCRATTANGSVDALLATRWKRAAAALGVDGSVATVPAGPGHD